MTPERPALPLLVETDLAPFRPAGGLAGMMRAMLRQQHATWPMLRSGYEGLAQVKTRSLRIEGWETRIQWNPGRIVSSSAKVDPKSISERPCFLCTHNLPAEQRGLAFDDDYLILCNPYPIFPEHFTIPLIRHEPQRMSGALASMLRLSKALGDSFWVFYNGPKCGASAPDHLHFQAGSADFLPLTGELRRVLTEVGEVLFDEAGLTVTAVPQGYLRSCFVVESAEAENVRRLVGSLMQALHTLQPGEEEPLVNILSLYSGAKWRVCVFPRAKHRPSMFFADGDDRILLSPAAVDLGGVLITPLEHDYLKMTERIVRDMFSEICLAPEQFRVITDTLREPGNPQYSK